MAHACGLPVGRQAHFLMLTVQFDGVDSDSSVSQASRLPTWGNFDTEATPQNSLLSHPLGLLTLPFKHALVNF